MFHREISAMPAVDEATLRGFLSQVASYIKENPIVVYYNEEHTLDLLKKKPFLYVPCQARAAGLCPDQTSNLPRCHRCPSSKVSAENLKKIGPPLGFTVDHPEEYPGLGSLVQNIRHTRTGSDMNFEVDGDNKGVGTIFVHDLRRPSSLKK